MGYYSHLLVKIVEESARSGKTKISSRARRRLDKLLHNVVDSSAKAILHTALKKYREASDTLGSQHNVDKQELSPDRVISAVDTSIAVTRWNTQPAVHPITRENPISIDDDTNESSTIDEFITKLKDKILLQGLLYTRIHTKKEQVFRLEHRNGRRLLVVLPPDVQSATAFQAKAKRTGWVDAMLHTEARLNGMLLYLATTHRDVFVKIASTRKIPSKIKALDTVQTMALACIGNLNSTRMKEIRSCVKHIGSFRFELSERKKDRIDTEVGNNRTIDQAIFGSKLHEWALVKGKEKKLPEEVKYWNGDLLKEVEVEVGMHLKGVIDRISPATTFNYASTVIPTIDYDAPGFDCKGVTVLFGGDHGDKHCPLTVKLNLTSPQERKKRMNLNFKCPIIQVASISCSKDTYSLLQSTIMPCIKQQLNKLKQMAIITVFSKKEPKQFYRSYAVPLTINMNTIIFKNNNSKTISFSDNKDKIHSIPLHEPFVEVPYYDLMATKVISHFNILYVGDLAFLAMLLGMNNSSGAHCLICEKKRAEFNCNHDTLVPRTQASLDNCLENYLLTANRANQPKKKLIANVKGVNSKGLIDIEPERIIIPILHCPMGLIDNIFERFKQLTNFSVEKFESETAEASRKVYKLKRQEHATAIKIFDNAARTRAANPTNSQARILFKESESTKKKTKQAVEEAKERYDEQMKINNARCSSLVQQYENVFRARGIKREAYHGGKFNGVNCIRIMDQSEELFMGTETQQGFLQHCLATKHTGITDEEITKVCQKYARLLSLMDVIWSSVRGIEEGLLPTIEQIAKLELTLKKAKDLWIEMKLSTLQPKWHLTFDGHLLQQVKQYGGLADKSDEVVEQFHQTLKKLRIRYKAIANYETRENCIRRELRRQRSLDIQRHIDHYLQQKKLPVNSKRALDALEKQDNQKRIKREKRDAVVACI